MKRSAIVALSLIGAGLLIVSCASMDESAQAVQERSIKEMVADGEGNVTPEESVAYYRKRFAAMDTDGDGYLVAEEFNWRESPAGGGGD